MNRRGFLKTCLAAVGAMVLPAAKAVEAPAPVLKILEGVQWEITGGMQIRVNVMYSYKKVGGNPSQAVWSRTIVHGESA